MISNKYELSIDGITKDRLRINRIALIKECLLTSRGSLVRVLTEPEDLSEWSLLQVFSSC